jgi:hypothetical protein
MADACEDCPRGHYCVRRISADPCPPGYYCPPKTGADLRLCPAGTYNPDYGIYEEDQCTQCDPGKYCQYPGQDNVTGDCAAGYYCKSGVDTDQPSGSHTGEGGICPIGSYCPPGTAVPLGCPAGRYTNVEQQSECTECKKGYYCTENATTYEDSVCPSGYYCPPGTRYSFEFPCPKGSYNPVNGSDGPEDCLSCPQGEYCEFDGMDQTSGYCSAGWFCTGGSYMAQPLPMANATDY